MVDASQGSRQTVANCYTAIELGVEVMPVLNKMDPAGRSRRRAPGSRGRDRHRRLAAVLASAKTDYVGVVMLARIVNGVL